MSLGDWFKRLFSSSAGATAPGEAEAEVDVAAEGAVTTTGGMGPGMPGTPAAAEAAEAELKSEEAPPDQTP
jgi:hypothetical protein